MFRDSLTGGSWELAPLMMGGGAVMAMQTVRVLRQLNLRPKRSIRVIAWMSEEFGGIGGIAYAKDHQSEIASHFAAIESDHGAGHPLDFTIKASQTVRPMLEPVSLVLQSSAGLSRFAGEVETPEPHFLFSYRTVRPRSTRTS